MAFYQLFQQQLIHAPLDELWGFISSPRNLKDITPDYMGFDITTLNLPKKMHEGMIICYKVSPMFGIKTNWVTEITHIREKSFFVDEQRIGPYAFWHHQHILETMDNGVLMKDIVTYQPPFGLLGIVANSLFIKNKLNEIFEYRRKALLDRFRAHRAIV